MKELIGLCVFGIIMFILAFVFGGWYIIQPGERGVSITLGKIYPEALNEGIGFKLPVVTKIKKMSIKNEMHTDNAECYTSDMQPIKVVYNTLFKLRNDKVITVYQQYKVTDETLFSTFIMPRMNEVLKQLTALYRAGDIVVQREAIRSKAIEKLRLAVGDIIEIQDISISNIDFSDKLEAAIELKVIEEQKALAAKFTVDKSKQDAEATIISAKAEAESIKIKGEALKQSEAMVMLEAVKKWNGVAPSTFLIGGTNTMLPIK